MPAIDCAARLDQAEAAFCENRLRMRGEPLKISVPVASWLRNGKVGGAITSAILARSKAYHGDC